jgi:hypothetical protein
MKKLILACVIALGLAGIGAAPAMADSSGSNPSPCGAVHGAFASVNGNFGYIGQVYQGAPNLHGGAVGQDPGATGFNNSNTGCQG